MDKDVFKEQFIYYLNKLTLGILKTIEFKLDEMVVATKKWQFV